MAGVLSFPEHPGCRPPNGWPPFPPGCIRLPGQPGRSQGPWACLGVSGTLDLSLVGVIERLSRCLSEAGVPLLAQSTYDTDYLFVPMDRLDRAVEALRAEGFSVRRADGNDLAVATSNA